MTAFQLFVTTFRISRTRRARWTRSAPPSTTSGNFASSLDNRSTMNTFTEDPCWSPTRRPSGRPRTTTRALTWVRRPAATRPCPTRSWRRWCSRCRRWMTFDRRRHHRRCRRRRHPTTRWTRPMGRFTTTSRRTWPRSSTSSRTLAKQTGTGPPSPSRRIRHRDPSRWVG